MQGMAKRMAARFDVRDHQEGKPGLAALTRSRSRGTAPKRLGYRSAGCDSMPPRDGPMIAPMLQIANKKAKAETMTVRS